MPKSSAGNISRTYFLYLDTVKPTGTIKNSSGAEITGSYTNQAFSYSATDSGSGVKTIYVKKPGASSYTEYASGTQLTADGAYSFYCVDNAGNASQTYTISMDHTRPTITSSVGGFGKTLKDGFTVTASDNYSGVTLYYKTPNSNSFVASTTSSVVFSKTAVNGTYVFYAVDGFRNRSDTCYMYMSIDAPEATIVKSDNSHKVCVIWTASNCYATLNGKSYTSGTWIEQEGEYTFIVTNDANRSTTYKFTVDHYYARYSMVAPTCTEEGYRGKKCRRCEDCVKTEILKAVGHKFTDSYFIATCEDEGYTLHTCLSCGNEYKDNIVPATGHDYETEVVREPHCETEGERKFHCTKCEKEYYSDIPATGHNYELTGTEEVNGENIRTYVCTNCGAITTQNMGEQYEQVSSYIGYLFGQYQPYMWWVLLATAGVWSIVMGVFFAIAQKNEDKEKARKMIKNYVIGLVVIFAILVACPYLVKGIAALIAG